MAKQYKVKDINNNGKIDGWEQGKYDAINNSATKMGYAMKMGSKQIDSISNFKTQDTNNISSAPAFPNLNEKQMVGDTLFAIKSISKPDMSGLSAPKAEPSKKLTRAAKKQQKLAKKRDAKIMQAKTERQLGNYELGKQRSSRAARIQKRIDRRAKRLSKK